MFAECIIALCSDSDHNTCCAGRTGENRMMKLYVLGMNGPFPEPGGATSGYLLTDGETKICMDLGSGTLQRLTERMEPADLDLLFFTHWHYDHCSDVLTLLYRLQAEGRKLKVIGPEDASSPVRAILEKDPQVELQTAAPGDRIQIGSLTLEVFRAVHPVPALMLRISDGKHVLCYTGDTNLQDGLDAFASQADLLLADGLFTEEIWTGSKPHLSAKLCAEIARDAGVRRLVITHLNPFIDKETLLKQARQAYPAAELARIGMCCQIGDEG